MVPRPPGPALACVGPGIGVLVGLVLVRRVLSGGLPEGDDVPYHVAKNAFAFTEIFARGHLNGWAPTFSMGAEQFLLYGPGASLLAASLRVLTLGMVDHRTLVGWVGAIGYVATAPAAYFLARGLHFRRTGASIVGLAALCVSVPFGAGPAGTFDLGLVPHQLAVPLVLLTLGALIRVIEYPDRRWVTLTAVFAMGVTVTHLTSALVTVAAFGVLITGRALVSANGASEDRYLTNNDISTAAAGENSRAAAENSSAICALYRVGLTGLLAAGFGAWWLVPLAENSGPRPSTATWDTPPLGDEVASLLTTRLWASQPIVIVAVIALAVCAVWLATGSQAMAHLQRWRASVIMAGPALLLVLYAMYHLLPGDTGLLMVNRGTGYAALLWILPIGVVADAAMARRETATCVGLVAALGLTLIAFPTLIPGSELVGPAPAPTPELQAASDVLTDGVAAEGRFAWVHEGGFDTSFGPVHPELWLAMEAEASTLNGFGGETITPVDTFLQYRLAEMDPRDAEPLLVRDGVSHLVGKPATLAAYSALPSWRTAWSSDRLGVLERTDVITLATPQSGQTTELAEWAPERVRWTTEGAAELVTGLPAFTKWHLTVDGDAADTLERDGFLTAALPDGEPHTVEATFRRSWGDRLGVLITLLVIAWRFGLFARLRAQFGSAPGGSRAA